MKKKLSIILSTLSLIGVLSVWVLWICESFEMSVITLDTFIGVIVALLAIIVTVAIGFQIVNAMDLRERLSQLEYQEQLSHKEKENFIKLSNNLQSGISEAEAQLYYDKKQYVEAFVFYNAALKYAIFADQQNQMTRIHHLSNVTKLIFIKPIVDYTKLKKIIECDAEAIRTTISYRNCLGEEYETMMRDFWTKMKQIGLENEEMS